MTTALYILHFKQRIILKLLCLLFAISVPLVVTEIYLRQNMSNESKSYYLRYKEYLSSSNKYDLVILGNSRASHGIIPSYLYFNNKYMCYNFSFNGAPGGFYKKLLPFILDKKPKLIIYTVNWSMFSNSLWRRCNMDNKYIYKYYPYVISEKTLLRPLLTNLKSSSGVIIRKYNNGYVPYSSPYTKDITNNKLNNTGAIDIEQLELFKRTIEEILNNNISIIFVDIPEYLNDRTNSKYINTNQEVLRELANKYNIRFLEYNNAMVSYINFDQSYFSDTAHLNDRGAQAFSKRLSADLKTYLETSKFLSK